MKNGRVLNANFAGYRVPRSIGVPKMNSILIETDDPEGPFGAKGMGKRLYCQHQPPSLMP